MKSAIFALVAIAGVITILSFTVMAHHDSNGMHNNGMHSSKMEMHGKMSGKHDQSDMHGKKEMHSKKGMHEGMHGEAAGEHHRASARGEVLAIGTDGKSLTIRHEPVAELGWPAMTMELALKHPALAEKVRVGDQITFELEQTSEFDYAITDIHGH
ncbi:hypothetical protein Selin_0039 [Desulfurispirillum indicum S5]|uniref:Uncharacterized protein n=1 Tax=Desulfurispirillum indicum (strain ATCC BAA-1389 / DSM 22839 / S5) TaxID=653733 RepID=E6W4S0_DESIS|nr:copper-binding protein [Desulfurispirillum indicum]ADU64798.1 hypothetical protein Selin_0039 [Desulfurispirillum indicum S5]